MNVEILNALIFSIPIVVIYYFPFETLFQRTPGKFITGTKVVSWHGWKPDAASVAWRTLSRLVPFEPLSAIFGNGWWHDRWSETVVVVSNPREGAKQVSLAPPRPMSGLEKLAIGLFLACFLLFLWPATRSVLVPPAVVMAVVFGAALFEETLKRKDGSEIRKQVLRLVVWAVVVGGLASVYSITKFGRVNETTLAIILSYTIVQGILLAAVVAIVSQISKQTWKGSTIFMGSWSTVIMLYIFGVLHMS